MTTPYQLISPTTHPDYRELISGVSNDVWPEFMHHDPVAGQYWDVLYEKFPAHQFALLDHATGAVVGMANSVPLAWDRPLQDLPDEGWDWALAQSAADEKAGRQPNLMSALQISVAPAFQRQGLSRLFLEHMRQLARSLGLQTLVAPVRPSAKHRYPLAAIESYITWKRQDGLPYDPWLRVHVRQGGRILKPCPSAMTIPGTIAEWQAWTGLHFFESGPYIVPGALVPVNINLDEDTGLYIEPNVWVVHALG